VLLRKEPKSGQYHCTARALNVFYYISALFM